MVAVKLLICEAAASPSCFASSPVAPIYKVTSVLLIAAVVSATSSITPSVSASTSVVAGVDEGYEVLTEALTLTLCPSTAETSNSVTLPTKLTLLSSALAPYRSPPVSLLSVPLLISFIKPAKVLEYSNIAATA